MISTGKSLYLRVFCFLLAIAIETSNCTRLKCSERSLCADNVHLQQNTKHQPDSPPPLCRTAIPKPTCGLAQTTRHCFPLQGNLHSQIALSDVWPQMSQGQGFCCAFNDQFGHLLLCLPLRQRLHCHPVRTEDTPTRRGSCGRLPPASETTFGKIFDPYEYHMDLCNESFSSGWSFVLAWQKL